MLKHLVFFLALAAPAMANDDVPLSGAEFENYTHGKTLYYLESGTVYGAEQYLENRGVLWAFQDDQCISGHWHEPEPGLICFAYEGGDFESQCWNFFRTDNGLRAVFDSFPKPTELYETRQSSESLFCPGPEIGV